MVSGATVGAVLAGRRPRHPVGWLLLALALSLTATAAAAQYLTWGLLVPVLVALAGLIVLGALAIGVPGATTLLSGAAGFCLAVLPLATGAAVLRYRLYDLDRIIGRTLAYALLTLLPGAATTPPARSQPSAPACARRSISRP